jgi:hypothetical protein
MGAHAHHRDHISNAHVPQLLKSDMTALPEEEKLSLVLTPWMEVLSGNLISGSGPVKQNG